MFKVDDKIVAKRKAGKTLATRLKSNKIARGVFCMGLSCSLLMTMVPSRAIWAGPGRGILTCPESSNNWGRSDLRVYLNNGLAYYDESSDAMFDKKYYVDSTEGDDKSNNLSGYAKHFNEQEYNLVQPWTYETNIMINGQEEPVGRYTLMDKFLLPSGNCAPDCKYVLSWDSQELEPNWAEKNEVDPGRLIPCSYWASSKDGMIFWLRTPDCNPEKIHIAQRGYDTMDRCVKDGSNPVAAIFKIDIRNVIFASSASAATLKDKKGGGEIKISEFSDYGKKTKEEIPDYGMYLKTKDDRSKFEVMSLSFADDGKRLKLKFENNVDFTNSNTEKFIVVQAFDSDYEGSKSISYAVTEKISEGQNTVSIDISNWDFNSFYENYTMKIWVEDGSGSLAQATDPETFIGKNDDLDVVEKIDDLGTLKNGYNDEFFESDDIDLEYDEQKEDFNPNDRDENPGQEDSASGNEDDDNKSDLTEEKNFRFFAMKEDLQCSWGNLMKLMLENRNDFNEILKGNATSEGVIAGKNPTNQKIYFGIGPDGKPLQFWIAGREEFPEDEKMEGELDPDGNIMCLYQAKSVESREFGKY